MNVPCSASRTAGSRSERTPAHRLPLLLALGLLLAGCRPPPPPALADFVPGSKEHAQVARIDPGVEMQQAQGSGDLGQPGLVATARDRVHLRGPDGGVLKLHLMLFDSVESAAGDYRSRHRPEAMATTRPLEAGDEAWIYPSAERGEHAGLRVGRVRYEIQARGAGTQLAAYVRAAAKRAAELERRRR